MSESEDRDDEGTSYRDGYDRGYDNGYDDGTAKMRRRSVLGTIAGFLGGGLAVGAIDEYDLSPIKVIDDENGGNLPNGGNGLLGNGTNPNGNRTDNQSGPNPDEPRGGPGETETAPENVETTAETTETTTEDGIAAEFENTEAFLAAAQDTTEDRVQQYDIRRQSILQGSTIIPEDELGTPIVEPGDTFYHGKYVVFEAENSPRMRPDIFREHNTTYITLTRQGYPVYDPENDEETLLSIGIENGGTYRHDQLEKIEDAYWHIYESADDLLDKEYRPATAIEDQSVVDILNEVRNEKNQFQEESTRYQQASETADRITKAGLYLQDEAHHYKSVTGMIDYVQQNSFFDDGTTVET